MQVYVFRDRGVTRALVEEMSGVSHSATIAFRDASSPEEPLPWQRQTVAGSVCERSRIAGLDQCSVRHQVTPSG